MFQLVSLSLVMRPFMPLPVGIVVGNAQAELVNWLVNQPQSGKIVYADAAHADGIIEGLARHSLY